MRRAKIEVIDEQKCDRQAIEKEDEEIRDFVKCHSMPSPDDEEGDKFWKNVINRLKRSRRSNWDDNLFIRKI